MNRLLTLGFLLIGFSLNAQTDTEVQRYAETIKAEDLKKHLEVLASDALQGRETGEPGQKMAAAYLHAQFKMMGLQAPVDSELGEGYYQKVELYSSAQGPTYISAGDKKFEGFKEFIYMGNRNMDSEQEYEVVFAGRGTEAELAALDIKGKAVAVIADSLNELRPTDRRIQDLGGTQLIIAIDMNDEEWKGNTNRFKRWLSGGRLSVEMPKESETMGTVITQPMIIADLMGTSMKKLEKAMDKSSEGNMKLLKKTKNSKIAMLATQKIEVMETENVLGYLEGGSKKEELLVITAHYDHVGVQGGEVYNGADDDGSGTVSVVEMAEAFVQAKNDGNGPERSILFMLVTGEEKGLLGSDYYTRNPVFPLENTVANLNIDMVGRIDPGHEENPNYIYLVGSDRLSTELHELSEEMNEKYTSLELDYTYNDEGHPDRIYYRSDHWNFAKNNIPIIFYFNGIHADYHKSTDTIEKINFEVLTTRARLVFYTAWEIANRESRLVVDKSSEE